MFVSFFSNWMPEPTRFLQVSSLPALGLISVALGQMSFSAPFVGRTRRFRDEIAGIPFGSCLTAKDITTLFA